MTLTDYADQAAALAVSAHEPEGLSTAKFGAIAERLAAQGYCILPAALPGAVAGGLMQALAAEPLEFSAAGIGRGSEQMHNRFIRRDKISWLDASVAGAEGWLNWTECLRETLNRELFLGLFSFESHLAIYEPGDFYQKHLDAFKGEGNRVLSIVAYLNQGWLPDQGGELVLYHPQATATELAKVVPEFGTLVAFLSEEFPHEVLPAGRTRYSVAGWYRVNSSTHLRVDPPV